MDVITENRQGVIAGHSLSNRIRQMYTSQLDYFAAGHTRSYAFRKAQLLKIRDAVKAYEMKIVEAMYKDFRKPEFEVYGTEVGPVYTELRYVLDNLRSWMKPKKVGTPLPFFPSSSWIYREPLGITLIISPWNYPFLLLMRPLISAIAGGNTVVLKPSEITAHTSKVIVEMITEYFDESYIAVIEGDGEQVGKELILNYHFDHIFFTGSVQVGKKVMEMASSHLSPVTLELGGKSPCIIDKEANLDFAAKKVAWSKFINAGQTCVAPDYILVHEEVRNLFVAKLKETIVKMYGQNPKLSTDFARIVSDRRFHTLSNYLSNRSQVIFGGESDAADRYIAPTLLAGVEPDDDVMKEEIFGPILPIIPYLDNREVFEWIGRNAYPLSLYIYTSNAATANFFTQNIRYGGGCINNGLIHLGNPELPFGGVGTSGIGKSHGRHGFDSFTREKSMMKTSTWMDAPLWYPPYGDHVKWIRKIFR
jgi:aldehyde dehydrogenase (NAD+)